MQDIIFYSKADVRRLLDYDGCIATMREAMTRFTADDVEQPLRNIIPLAPDKLFALMPGTLPAPGIFGAKVITAFGDPAAPGRSQHRGVVVIVDRDSGEVVCIADAGEVTHIRTPAASAVATDVLARANASRLAIFGCGAQAATHIRALSRVRDFSEVVIWGRSHEAASAFARRMAEETGLSVRAEADGRKAADADVICTVTGSTTPILLGDWVGPGTHINAVGSSHAGSTEIDSALVAKSRYIADSVRSARAAAAEFLDAVKQGVVDDGHLKGEIGEVLLGRIAGRTSAEEITLYKSLGHVVQDLAAVQYLHEAALVARPDSRIEQ